MARDPGNTRWTGRRHRQESHHDSGTQRAHQTDKSSVDEACLTV
jgi:hypothetical protein